MTEEQFWKSNPRTIEVWAKAWKMRENRQNELTHSYVGNYVLSALFTAIDGVLNGRKAKARYIDKPIQLFELTEEEIKSIDSININSRLRFDPDNLDFHSVG